MRSVEQPHEKTLRDSGGHFAELQQAIDAQIADAREVPLVEPGRADHVREDGQPLLRRSRERRQADQRGVGADFRIQLCAEPAEALVHCERVEAAAPLVQEIAGDCRESRAIGGIVRRARAYHHERADEGNFPVFGGPDRHPVRQPRATDLRERERQLRAGRRKLRAIDHHDTDTGCDPLRAREAWPRGTALSATRAFPSQAAAARCRSAAPA